MPQRTGENQSAVQMCFITFFIRLLSKTDVRGYVSSSAFLFSAPPRDKEIALVLMELQSRRAVRDTRLWRGVAG